MCCVYLMKWYYGYVGFSYFSTKRTVGVKLMLSQYVCQSRTFGLYACLQAVFV
jgi:hypothetical protein